MAAHPIVHIELAASNLESTSTFYRELFGWTIQPIPEMQYVLFNPQEGPGGGFAKTAEDGEQEAGVAYRPGDVVPYVQTADLEATLSRVEELGGRVLLGKTEIPNMGWFALFSDVTGNRIGLYTPAR